MSVLLDPNCPTCHELPGPERNLSLGVDPGSSGGLALLDGHGTIVDLTRMPETASDIAAWFEEFAARIRYASIEAVHAFPGQGVTSMFSFGHNAGLLEMALVAHKIPFEFVRPQVWQKSFGLIRSKASESVTDKKNRHKGVAQQLFPDYKIIHATADAVLIAEFCRRKAAGLL